MVTYKARFERDRESGGYTVTLPDFGWGVTQGDNLADAEKWAGRLLHDMIAHVIKNNEAIPEARAKGRGLRAVALDSLAQAKVECYLAFRASGLRKSELARRLGIRRRGRPAVRSRSLVTTGSDRCRFARARQNGWLSALGTRPKRGAGLAGSRALAGVETGVGLDDGWRADRASRRVSTRQAESPRHEERVRLRSEAADSGEGVLWVGGARSLATGVGTGVGLDNGWRADRASRRVSSGRLRARATRRGSSFGQRRRTRGRGFYGWGGARSLATGVGTGGGVGRWVACWPGVATRPAAAG